MVHWDRRAFRRQLILQISILIGLVAVIALSFDSGREQLIAEIEGTPLEVVSRETIDLREVSGLASFTEDGKTELAFIGDDKARIYLRRENKEYDFKDLLVSRFSLCADDSFDECDRLIKKLSKNWEALAVDGDHRFFALQEHTQSIVVLNRAVDTIEHVIQFNFADAFPEALAKGSKKFKKNALAEGFVLLQNGHILVAKEAHPIAFVEFGPAGDEPMGFNAGTFLREGEPFSFRTDAFHQKLVPLHTWALALHSKCDISDLTIDQNGSLLTLSEDCRNIHRYRRLVVGERPDPSEVFQLPAEVKNPEGLAVADDEFLVGSDIPSRKLHNFYRLRRESKVK